MVLSLRPRVLLVALALVSLAPSLRAQPVLPDSAATDAAPLTEWGRSGPVSGFDALPVRSVRGVAVWAPGLRRDLATGALTTRARRGPEPRFVVDGVRQLDGPGLPFEAVRRVQVLTEGVPARYGQAAAGLVLVDTEAGPRALSGRLEAFSSRATDAFGTDLGALALRAPLGPAGGVWLAAEVGRQEDASPYGVAPFQLTDEAYARLQATPQSIAVTENGATRFVAFPAEAARAAFEAGSPLTGDDLRRELGLTPDATVDLFPVSTVETLGEDAFERRPAKDDPLDDLRLAGGLAFRPLDGLRVRLAGRLDRQRAERSGTPFQQFAALPFNRDGLSDAEQNGLALTAALDHDLSPTVGYRVWASVERQDALSRPLGFSDDVADALSYGDTDDPSNAVAGRYFVPTLPTGEPSEGVYVPQYGSDSGWRLSTALLTFDAPGRLAGRYEKRDDASIQAGGALTLRLGGARVELGGEIEQQTHRRFVLDGLGLAAYENDADGPQFSVPGFPEGVRAYGDLPFSVLWRRTENYGYTFNGLAEADDQDLDAYFAGGAGAPQSFDVAPFRPRTVAGYLDAERTWGALDVRLGLRVEAYDARATVLLDPFAPRPITRAGDLGTVPSGIDDDFAVYYAGSGVVGYRDLDGQFYDAEGTETSFDAIIVERRGQVREIDAPRSSVFRDAPVHVRVEPRLRLAVQASPSVRLVASADRLSRRPDPSSYAPFAAYQEVSSSSVVGNAALRPETVDVVRLGAEAEVGAGVSLGAAAFFRQADDLPVSLRLDSGFPAYTTLRNAGRLRETGVDLTVAWAPSPSLALRGAYTLAVAEAKTSTTQGPFRGLIPDAYQTAPGDTRHALDVVLAARVPDGAGPRMGGVSLLGGLGGGLTLRAQSGRPYTSFVDGFGVFPVFDSFTPDIAALNDSRLPWTSQLDLRLDKRIAVAGAAVEAFVWVENLLDADNVLAVYRLTGEPDQDGLLDTARGQSLYNTPEMRFLYQAYTSGAVNVGGRQSTDGDFFYGRPRQIRLGLRATF